MVGQTVSLAGIPGDASEPRGVWSTRDMQFVNVQVCVRLPVMRGKYVPRQPVVCGVSGVFFKGEKKVGASKGPLVSFSLVYQCLTWLGVIKKDRANWWRMLK